ncbi:TIGR02234 family membrane protein [Nocardia sp. NPDC060256]|uniref:TIGR02234 family membrane protein n=1 Tax=unclassified Nocardia TaxID=2637762 RepID=UPI00366367F5
MTAGPSDGDPAIPGADSGRPTETSALDSSVHRDDHASGESAGATPDPDLVTPETAGAETVEPARRKSPIGALVLLAVAAAALWGSSRMTWVTVTSTDGLTEPRTDHLNGGVWFGALTPLALVLLASIAAVLATRGWLRRVLGVVLALVAAVAAVPAFALLTNSGKIAERAAKLAELPARAQVGEATTSVLPAVLALLGALAAFAAGGLLARMPQDTARLSGKYDNPVVRRAAATEQVTKQRDDAAEPGSTQLSERVLWDALDAGTDPTEDAVNSGGRPDDPDAGRPGGPVR